MGRGQITSPQADLRSADKVEMVPMATARRSDLKSGCLCLVCVWRDWVEVHCRYVSVCVCVYEGTNEETEWCRSRRRIKPLSSDKRRSMNTLQT